MQVSSSFIERVMEERRQASVLCFWLTLELPSSVIDKSPPGCAEQLLNSKETGSQPCIATHTCTAGGTHEQETLSLPASRVIL